MENKKPPADAVRKGIDAARERRLQGREAAFRGAKDRHESFARSSGAYAIGTDENGAAVETRTLKSFSIILDRWYVRMGFKKEDREKMASESWQQIEAALKNGDVPRKNIRFDTHLLAAVRTLKHVRESYEREIEETDALLATLDAQNLKLAEKGARRTDAELDAAIACLESADALLSAKEVAIKKQVARGRIERTKITIQDAKKMPLGGPRDMLLSRACAVFTSVRERLGTWREKTVAGIKEYNLQKECALRPERDKWLFSQLSRFAEDTKAVFQYCAADSEKIAVLDQIRAMLKGKEPKERILEFIKEKHPLFRVSGRAREGAEKWIALAEAGKQPKIGSNVDYLIGHYAMLYRYVAKGNNGSAYRKLGFLELFVDANKPRYIVEELRQNTDPYLVPALEAMENGLVAFESKNFKDASAQFTSARDMIKKFAYPGAR